MKVLGCKIEDNIYEEFKKQNSNVSKALRELIIKSTSQSGKPVVNRIISDDRLDSIHKYIDTFLPLKNESEVCNESV